MKRQTCSRAALRDGSIAYTFRGSEYGMCAHRHIACLRGFSEAQIDAKARKMFDAGNRGEEVAKKMLLDLAARDSRLSVIEFASGYQNQESVSLVERRSGFPDGIEREIRLICSPDGLLNFPLGFAFPADWEVRDDTFNDRPMDFALEVKCYGESSLKKFRSKGIASNETLEWQTSGVAHGYAARLGRPVGVVVMVLRRDEIKDEQGNFVDYDVPVDQVPRFHVVSGPRYTATECLQRCWDIANVYERGEWPKCSNSYFCKYPHRPSPVIDVIAEDSLTNLAEAWEKYQVALRDAEGLLIGVNNGDQVHGYAYCRQLLSLPLVKRL